MIRTVWLAAFCLAGVGGLCASKVTASITAPQEGVPDQTMVSTNIASDTLTRADRLDVTNLRPVAEATIALPRPDPVAALPIKLKTTSSGNLQRQSPPNANRRTATLPKPRPKVRLPKNSNSSNSAGDLKTCPQTEGLGSILMLFSGMLRCS
jgi:hypothetical protein